jgi:drug/metabolite transporter (DMT)-like permease
MLLGITFKILSAFTFTAMAALIRAVGETAPTGQVVFFRSFFAILPLILWLAFRGELKSLFATRDPRRHLLRCGFGLASMFLGFAALARLPLPDATIIGYAAPLLTVVMAAVLLGERVRTPRWSAVVVGLVGIIVMLWPRLSDGALASAVAGGGGADKTAIGVLFGLAAAALSAGAMIQMRQLAQTEPPGVIVFIFSAVAAAAGLATLPLGWAPFEASTWVMLVFIGVLGGVGQILMTLSYRVADASMVAPFDYTSMLWALLLGWFFLGELPTGMTLAGASIVVAAALGLIVYERRLLKAAVDPAPRG